MEEKTDLRIIKTYKALCETFMELCSEKTFEDITVGELCDRALIRRATFYKHFSDKYDFFAFFVRYIQDQFSSHYEAQQADDFYTFVFEECSNFLIEHKSMVNCIMQSSAFSTLMDILTDEIQKNVYLHLIEQKKDSSMENTEVKLLSYFFAGGTIQLYRYWLINQKTVSKEEIFSIYKKLVEQMLETNTRS